MISVDRRPEAAALYASGLSIGAVAVRMHSSFGSVRRALLSHGVELRKSHEAAVRATTLPAGDRERTIALYQRGLPVTVIAEHLGITPGGVYQRLRRSHVALRDTSDRVRARHLSAAGKLAPIPLTKLRPGPRGVA